MSKKAKHFAKITIPDDLLKGGFSKQKIEQVTLRVLSRYGLTPGDSDTVAKLVAQDMEIRRGIDKVERLVSLIKATSSYLVWAVAEEAKMRGVYSDELYKLQGENPLPNEVFTTRLCKNADNDMDIAGGIIALHKAQETFAKARQLRQQAAQTAFLVYSCGPVASLGGEIDRTHWSQYEVPGWLYASYLDYQENFAPDRN